MLTSIVGMEIEVTRLVGKSKLSQNKEVRDIRTAGETLRQKGEKVIANAMLAVADEKDA
jgi:transcriptional regulator